MFKKTALFWKDGIPYHHNSVWPAFEAGTVPLVLILKIKDPSNHGPLILQPIFVGTLEQFVVYLSSTISSLSPLSLNSFPPSLASGHLANLYSSICDFKWSLVSHFSTTDETAADEALSSFCHSGRSEVWSIHFSKDFHKSISLFLVINIHLKICPQALFFQNIGLCKNFDILIS